MDLKSIRDFVSSHPHGVLIKMVDGTKYEVPHRDYIWMGPPPEARTGRGPHSTSFIVHTKNDEMRLVNALLVTEISGLSQNGNGHAKPRKGKRKSG
jgi:hypothetical protein